MDIIATRREKVLLELEDHFSSQMVKPIAATKALDAALDSLSGSSVGAADGQADLAKSTKGVGDQVEKTSKKTKEFTLEQAKAEEATARLRKSLRDEAKALLDAEQGIDHNNDSLRDGTREIDRYSGRLRLLTEAAIVLGPALVPIGAVAVPATIALASGLGAAAGAAGVALLAFNGVGDALSALDAYQLDPTTAHLEKMQEEFEKLGPTGVEFVQFLDSIEPELKSLQEVARQGVFPGVEEGITSLLDLMPQVRVIAFDLATELGKLSAQAGDALAGDRWSAFFDYLQTDAAPTLEAFAHTVGNVAEGLGSLLVAFAPLSRDFSSGMESMSQSFADWAAGLSETDGFRDFVSYVRESGPQVLDLLGSLATAFIDIARAAAPVGAAVLPALTALADILGAIAASPIGPPLFTAVAAMLAINRATTLVTAGLDMVRGSAEGAGASISNIGKGVAGITAVIATADLLQTALNKIADTSVDTSNLGRSLEALANGKTTADLGDLFHTFQDVQNGWQADWNPISWISSWDPSGAENAEKSIKAIDTALAQMVESGDAETAAEAFANLGPSAEKAGLSLSQLNDLFPEYATALDNAGTSADSEAEAARKVAEAHNREAAAAEKAANSTAGLTGAMEDATEAALGAFDAETRYREALKAAAAQAGKNSAGIRGNSDAVLANRSALSQLAGAWNNQSVAVKNNVARWREARGAFIDTATAMGVPIDRAKELADRLMQIPKQIVIKQSNNMDPAVQTAKLLAQAIRNIPTKWLTTYTVNTIRTGTKPELHAPRADGGEIFGQRHPYGDKVLAMLAPGEEVISNRHGEADRFRADRAAGRIPAYANGGMVGFGATLAQGFAATPDKTAFLGFGHQMDQFSHLLRNLNDLNERELKKRERIAGKAKDLAEKSLENARDRLDEEKGQLKDLRDARKQFAQDVANNFRTDIFGGGLNLESAASQGLLGPNFASDLLKWLTDNKVELTAGTKITDYAGQYLDTLTPAQIAALQAQASIGQLGMDSQNADAFAEALKQLAKLGLSGGAFDQLATSGNLSLAQAYLSMGKGGIKDLEAAFKGRQGDLRQLGKYVGNERFGADIREQLKVTQKAAEVAEKQLTSLHQVNQAVKDLNRRMDRLQQTQEQAPRKTGDAVANAVNNAVGHGQKK